MTRSIAAGIAGVAEPDRGERDQDVPERRPRRAAAGGRHLAQGPERVTVLAPNTASSLPPGSRAVAVSLPGVHPAHRAARSAGAAGAEQPSAPDGEYRSKDCDTECASADTE